MVEALDVFVGRPWIGRDGTDAVVGLPYDIKRQRPVFPEAEACGCGVRQFT